MLRSFFAKILAAALLVAVPAPTFAAVFVGVSVRIGPPAIPYYVQPPVPRPGLLWAPGYWAWSGNDYYWVPGTWVGAPRPGYLWTPGYWAFNAGYYGWHPGYWGPHVGFYGGINYGYGYFGVGFVGGGWYRGAYRYNTAYTNVNRTFVRNVYVNKTVVNNFYAGTTHASYNGGPNGTRVTPSASEVAAARTADRIPATSAQTQHQAIASQNKNAFATTNDGHPHTAAVARPFDASNRPADFTPRTAADRVGNGGAAGVGGTAAGRGDGTAGNTGPRNNENGAYGPGNGRGRAGAGSGGNGGAAAQGGGHAGHRGGHGGRGGHHNGG